MGRLSEYDEVERAILTAHGTYGCPHCGLESCYCCFECGQDLLLEDHLPACLSNPNEVKTGPGISILNLK